MTVSPNIFPKLLAAVVQVIENNAVELSELDQAIGDGDHVSNLQRGLQALNGQSEVISQMDWTSAFQKIGMTIMSSVGGASGSLYGTLFIALSKNMANQQSTQAEFAQAFLKAVDAVKARGKADKGEKTMLDVLIPVADELVGHSGGENLFAHVKKTAELAAESTKDMTATKGRAAFLGERSKGHMDPGAKSSQLMICAVIDALTQPS